MKYLVIVGQMLVLTVFYLIGMWIQKTFNLFIPGSLIGMILLFVMLVTKTFPHRFIEKGSSFILRHMPLFFIPVTVGILQFLDVFAGKGILIVFITLISTMMVLVTTGMSFEMFARHKGGN